MRAVLMLCLALALTPVLSGARKPTQVRLRLGDRTTLHIGQIAVLRLSPNHPYSVTLDGDAVVPLESAQNEATHSYRAVHPGNATLLITPTDQKKKDCVDCVTRHCFLTVKP